VDARTYKLDELAHAAGMSARTVRYYVQRGLLAAPAFRGKDTAYTHEHLVRLRAIRRLQAAFLPLDAIAAELAARTLGEIASIADGEATPRPSAAPVHGEARAPDEEDPRLALERKAPRGLRRIELFPGVELTVADDAPDRSVRRVSELLTIVEAMSKANTNEGGRER
jgi:Ca-activated chloride channel family protein